MRQIQNEFMAHAVANEWRSQKEVILLSQVVRITLLHLEDKNVYCAKTAGRNALKMIFPSLDACEWSGEHLSR